MQYLLLIGFLACSLCGLLLSIFLGWLDVRAPNSDLTPRTESYLERPLAFIFGVVQILAFGAAIISAAMVLLTEQKYAPALLWNQSWMKNDEMVPNYTFYLHLAIPPLLSAVVSCSGLHLHKISGSRNLSHIRSLTGVIASSTLVVPCQLSGALVLLVMDRRATITHHYGILLACTSAQHLGSIIWCFGSIKRGYWKIRGWLLRRYDISLRSELLMPLMMASSSQQPADSASNSETSVDPALDAESAPSEVMDFDCVFRATYPDEAQLGLSERRRTKGAVVCTDNDTRWNSWRDDDTLAKPYDHGYTNAPLRAEEGIILSSHLNELLIVSFRDYMKQRRQGTLTCCTRLIWAALYLTNAISKESPVCATALLLDPSKRARYLEIHWKRERADTANTHARAIWKEEYKMGPRLGYDIRIDQSDYSYPCKRLIAVHNTISLWAIKPWSEVVQARFGQNSMYSISIRRWDLGTTLSWIGAVQHGIGIKLHQRSGYIPRGFTHAFVVDQSPSDSKLANQRFGTKLLTELNYYFGDLEIMKHDRWSSWVCMSLSASAIWSL
ncbi:hypothetical protein IQ07DRAFT_606413 [Pyrenochaeta sp. DS3sAY3a]|nr:hypothetical protein IQ07DRAFT_606413 [Pyrenochaeta sp. DS3sAY3a]